MLNQRRFRGTNFARVVFSNSVICLEKMGITLTKKKVLKEEGDNFEGIIEGFRSSSAGKVIIQLKIHGWRDMTHHMGFWPTSLTTDVIIETFEITKDKKLPNSPIANALNEEFNKKINLYTWHTAG